jgi:hypothetical protein
MKRCDGVTRREFLRVGSLSAFGLGVADALRSRSWAATSGRSLGTSRNCILIWLDGGPSHLDTFDLKPDAPAEVRGDFKPAATNVPGIRICEYFRRLATMMDRTCIIRSMTSELGEHNFGRHYLLTGYKPTPVLPYPSYGSVVAHCRGAGVPRPESSKGVAVDVGAVSTPFEDSGRATRSPHFSALPAYVSIPNASEEAANGYLPGSTRPFAVGGDPSKPDFRVRDLDMPDGFNIARLDRRREFLADFDRLSEQIEKSAIRENRDAQFEQAYRLITSPEAKRAFDLSREKPTIRQQYGPHRIGQSCLLARRLVDAGCPFVTVTDNGWDMHGNIYRELKEGYVGGSNGKIILLDQALSALLDDLSQHGLLDETLVIVMGEFGRTPKLNTAAGRDHWPRAFSVLLAGGGVRGGQVVGASDSRGEAPADRPVTPTDLARTIYTLLGIDPDCEFHTADGRPVKVSPGGQVISECLT